MNASTERVKIGIMNRSVCKKRPFYFSMLSKLILSFLFIGLVPLIAIGQMIHKSLSGSVENIMVENAIQLVNNFGINVENLIQNYDKASQYIYDYTSESYTFLIDILENEDITFREKETEITSMISSILYTNIFFENVRFVTSDDEIYHVSKVATKIINKQEILNKKWKPEVSMLRDLYIIPSHSEEDYYYNSDKKVITLIRNYMDISTVATAENCVLGTVYIDINPQCIAFLEKGLNLGESSRISLINVNDGILVYSDTSEEIGTVDTELKSIVQGLSGESGSYLTDDAIYAYYNVRDTGWLAVAKLDKTDINGSYVSNARFFIIFLIIISLLLSMIYYIISSQTTKPARILKEAMEKIQRGELETRVSIHTHDELEILGNGLNEMAGNLQKYINQMYVAEINQKEAELKALKSTIKPHYLYNTLEVIKMSAITNEDLIVADMIDSLSRQLQYLIGYSSDFVTLKEEIQNIKDYFYIVHIRYENRLELELDIDNDCMELHIPKLILQPIVENAVKHGLRPKLGNGKVEVIATINENFLQITVMDDGVGMKEEELTNLKKKLEAEETIYQKSSIGMKNVYDRIKKNYGNLYGYHVVSERNLGTIVKFKLPIIK